MKALVGEIKALVGELTDTVKLREGPLTAVLPGPLVAGWWSLELVWGDTILTSLVAIALTLLGAGGGPGGGAESGGRHRSLETLWRLTPSLTPDMRDSAPGSRLRMSAFTPNGGILKALSWPSSQSSSDLSTLSRSPPSLNMVAM